MTIKHIAMMLAAPIALAAAPADAAVLSYALTGNYDANFLINTDLVKPPVDSGSDYFVVENIMGTFGGVNQAATSIQFSTFASNGGFTIELPGGNFLGFFGAQLFTGSTALPTMRLGQFALTSDVDSSSSTLSVGVAVPEPATWAMMVAGFATVGFAMRRRKTGVAEPLAA